MDDRPTREALTFDSSPANGARPFAFEKKWGLAMMDRILSSKLLKMRTLRTGKPISPQSEVDSSSPRVVPPHPTNFKLRHYPEWKPPSPPTYAIDGRDLHSALFLESQSTQIAVL
jgi:hypothetical protein